MAESDTINIPLRRAAKARLETLATAVGRTSEELAQQAIESYLNLDSRQVAAIGEALAEADAGGPFVRHEDMVVWLESWGTDDELPAPEANIRA
jgi:predicted transcriptional regulator